MKPGTRWALYLLFAVPAQLCAQMPASHDGHHGHRMLVTADGVVMNENRFTLPRNCKKISRDYYLTVHAGTRYAGNFPGTIFGMSPHEIHVQPCSRVELTFVNDDQVRHQWMLHGLPNYLYPAGMVHIEASGGKTQTGTFIVPADDHTYLVHCDMAQHMEKGMRGQLVVGKGSGNLWGVAGISDQFYRFAYLPKQTLRWVALVIGLSFLLSLWATKKWK